MELIIIGKRSLLSSYLKKNINNCNIFSSEDFKSIEKLNKNKTYCVILNSFYPSSKLKKEFSYRKFFDSSINNLIKILEILQKFKIKKIIHSSSSAIYNSLNSEIFIEKNFNRKIYATTKITVENILTDFCSKKKISFINARIFNMYGENDQFSIISKIINSKKNKKKINIFNNGNSVRDFIHANDVAKIYLKLIRSKKNIFGTIDVGTGKGTKISELINFIGIKNLNINFSQKKINEAKEVIANTQALKEVIGDFKFSKLENFLKKYFQISKFKKINNIDNNNFKNLLQDIVTEPVIIITSFHLKSKVKSMFDKNPLKPKYYVIDDGKEIEKNYFKKNYISYEKFKNLNANKTFLNIIISNYNLKEEEKLLYWNKYKKFSKNVTFYNFSKNLNFYEIEEDLNFNYLFERYEKKFSSSHDASLKNKRILITGGAGSIGSEICKQLLVMNTSKVIAYDNSEFQLYRLKNQLGKKLEIILGDINDIEHLENIVKKNKIDYIFHAAAFKHVNILESNIQQAVKNNIFGTLSVVRIAIKYNCKLSVISTDKSANPFSVLGYTKRISEIISKIYQDQNKTINVIRFGNVYASQGSAIPHFVNQILKNNKVTITNENVKRFFMSVSEAAKLVINSIKIKDHKNSIFILEMGKQIKIIKVVKKIINLLGKSSEYSKKGMIKFEKLNQGEKIKENLYISKKITNLNNNIIAALEPIYSRKQVDILISSLMVNKNNPKKLKKIMEKFLINEI